MAFDIDEFLAKSYKTNASDIHLNPQKTPALRISGKIYKTAGEIITLEDIQEILKNTLPEEYQEKFNTIKDIDYIYELKNVARYRVNYCKDISGGKLTFRTIPYKIKALEKLSLPEYLHEYTDFNNGIVFVTGPTGCGKSTTLASLIEMINQKHKKHIVTIEDPVEFIYEDKKSIITQRSLDVDVNDFKSGIKYALRQDPDVILVGEIRDKETLLSALEAAETGHLVFSTLHTNGASETIDRLKGFIDEAGQNAFMKRIAGCIRGIIHQQLVPTTKDGKLTPAIEVLTFTPTVADYVKSGKMHEVKLLMQTSRQPNICTMNSSLYKLYEQNLITKETAYNFSLEKAEMDQRLRGMYRDPSLEDEDSII